MESGYYDHCRTLLCHFIAGDHAVRLSMIKRSLDDVLLFARYTAPKDGILRQMLVAVVRGLQDRYTRGITDAALVYISEHPGGFKVADLPTRVSGEDVHDHGRLEDVESIAHAAGYPVHELKDLFVELGDPGKPGYPRGIADTRAGDPPGARSEHTARARDPTVISSQKRRVADGGIHNFCSVLIEGSVPGRHPSPSISDQEREYVEDSGAGLSSRHAPYARTPGCPHCVRAGRRCIPTAKCCASCDGVDIWQTLPAYQAQLAHNINNSTKSLLKSNEQRQYRSGEA